MESLSWLRQRNVLAQIADALDALSRAVAGGQVLRSHFGSALQELLGPLSEALPDSGDGSEREWFAMAIAIGQQADTEPLLLLERLRARCQQQEAQHAQLDAIAARAHRRAYSLCAVPLVLLVLLLLARPPLVHSAGSGLWLLWALLAAVQCAGLLVLERRLWRLRWSGWC